MYVISPTDLIQFISENYLTFLLLGGLLILMLTYRGILLPATKNFQFILLILFLMSMSNSLERWATYSPDRLQIRVIASVIHYILQPFVILLELIIIIPKSGTRHRLKIFLLSLPVIINTIIYLLAPFAGKLVFYYDEHYWFHSGILGYSIYIVTFFCLVLLLLGSVRFRKQNNPGKSLILFFIVLSAALTGILEGLNIISGYIDEAFALGVLLYYIFLVTMYESEVQSKLARKELELYENRVRLMREQIQPHFIFNSLQIIRSLIRTDQKKAIQGVEDFSDYLQANLDAITSDRLIPFEDELAHVEAYVALALADDSKGISVLYDIRERSFRLPPLTVEPLVENAIRHGIPTGGTVILSTCSDQDGVLITISDNGTGFDHFSTEKEKKRLGIGIQNVRTRLATLCNGTLDIKSNSGGTVIMVRLPKYPAEKV